MTTSKSRRGEQQATGAVDMDAIAGRLGVSKTTVHYALSGKGRVSIPLRKEILKVADEMGYRPNLLARSLRTKKTHTLGVILSSLSSSFHAHLLESIDHAAQEKGYNILLACSYRDAAKESELLEMMLSKGVDGVIAAPTNNDHFRLLYDELLNRGVPLVFVDRDIPKSRIDCVSVDNFVGGRLAGEHLIEIGCRHVAFVNVSYRKQQTSTIKERLNGLNSALQSAGLNPAKTLGLNLVQQCTGEAAGYRIVSEALETKNAPIDGLFAANDNLAHGAIRAVRDAGLRIPEDVAIIGFDDQDASAYVDPPLSTIRQPVSSLGKSAIEMLLKHLESDSKVTRKSRNRLRIEPTLVRRAST